MSDDRIIVVGAGHDLALQAELMAALKGLDAKIVLEADAKVAFPAQPFKELKMSNVFEDYLPEPGAKRIRRRKGGSPAERLLEEQRKLRAKSDKGPA